MSGRNWLIALLSLSAVINYLDRQSLSVLLPTLRSSLNLTTAQYSNISTAFLIAYSLGQLFAGPFINRAGIRNALALSVALWSLAAMLHGLASSALQFLALRILLGLGESTNWPIGVKAISLWVPQHQRALYLGIFDGGAAIGSALAFPLIAGLTLQFGWPSAFAISGAFGFLWLLFWLPAAPASTPTPPPPDSPSPQLLRHPLLWGLILTRFFATPVWWFYIFWLSDYLALERGLSLTQIGIWGWFPYLSVDLGKLAGGRLSDHLAASGRSFRNARCTVMAVGALMMAAGVFVATASTVPLAIFWAAIGTFGFGLWSVNILALHADTFPHYQMATAVGITTAAGSLGGAVFSWFTGRIVDTWGYQHAFTLTAAIAVTAYAVLHFSIRPLDSTPPLSTNSR